MKLAQLVFVSAFGTLFVGIAAQVDTVTVDYSIELRRIDGFGFCQTFGRAYVMNGSEGLPWAKQQEVLDLLLSPVTGAGFSILRLGVFGIQPSNPGGPDSPPQYVWDGDDGRQLWLAKHAQAYGVQRFFANPWSAPAYMKTNNDVSNGGELCGAPGTEATCGGVDWRQAYANYLLQYVRFYAQEGIPIQHLAFTNEPDWTAGYDSMRFTPEQAVDFVKVIGPTIAAEGSGLNLSLVCCDSLGWGSNHATRYTQAIEADAEAAHWVNVHTGHSYASPSNALLPTARDVWMSEYALDAVDVFNPFWDGGDSTNSGIALANHIHDTLAGGNVNAYLTWFGASLSNTAAPIQLDGANYNVAKRLWATAAWSRFVRPGAIRVSAGYSNRMTKATAFRNVDGTRVVNIINNDYVAVTVNCYLAGTFAGETLTVYRTDEGYSLDMTSVSEMTGALVPVELPARSLTTLVIE